MHSTTHTGKDAASAVFLHGFGADCLSWLGNMGALPEIDKKSPDLRGHGNSLTTITDGSLEDLATGVMADIGDGPPAWLLGHSLGGGVALWLAANHPERWKGLFLMAPLGLGQGVDMKRLRRYPEITDEDEMMGFLESLVFDRSKMKREFAAYALSQFDKPGGREGLRKIVERVPEAAQQVKDLLPRVIEAGLDVTVFWGSNDTVAKPDPNLIAPFGPMVTCPDTGHIVHVEAMPAVNAHLRQRMGLD